MLIRFKVENFRSLRDCQELSFVPSNLKGPPDSVAHVDGYPSGALRVAAIYGANASGKTSVLRALNYFVRAVSNSHRAWKPDSPIPVEPFLLDEKKRADPSSFEVDFLLGGVRYQFGFDINSQEVLKEWLYSYPSSRKQVWFEREGGQHKRIAFGKKLSGENRAIESMTRPNSLFLSAAAQNNHEMLLPIFRWLTGRIVFEFDSRGALTSQLAQTCDDPDMKERLSRLLSAADLGVIGLNVEKEKMAVSEGVREAMNALVRKLYESTGKAPKEPLPDLPMELPKMSLRHKSTDPSGTLVPTANESAGTAAFLALLIPSLNVIESGGVLCVDELDSSLHPLLALEIVRSFSDPLRNPRGAQLIFSTHDVNLLDSSILRRDEIWFTEKDSKGATHLYSLGDFKPRRRENLKGGYLQGRYGAVPFLGSFDFGRPSS